MGETLTQYVKFVFLNPQCWCLRPDHNCCGKLHCLRCSAAPLPSATDPCSTPSLLPVVTTKASLTAPNVPCGGEGCSHFGPLCRVKQESYILPGSVYMASRNRQNHRDRKRQQLLRDPGWEDVLCSKEDSQGFGVQHDDGGAFVHMLVKTHGNTLLQK